MLRTARVRHGLGIVLNQDEAGILWADTALDLREPLKAMIDGIPLKAETGAVPLIGRLGIVDVQRLANESRLGKELGAKRRAQASELETLQAEFQKRAVPVLADLGREAGLRVVLSAADSGIVWMDPALDATAALVARLDAATHGQGPQPAPWSPPPAAVAEPRCLLAE